MKVLIAASDTLKFHLKNFSVATNLNDGEYLSVRIPAVPETDEGMVAIDARLPGGKDFGGQVRITELIGVLKSLVEREHERLNRSSSGIGTRRRDRKKRPARKS